MKIISNVGEPNVSQIYQLIARKMRPKDETLFVTISGRIETEFSREFPVVNIEKLVKARLASAALPQEHVQVKREYSAQKLREIYSMDYALLGTPEKELEEKTKMYIACWLQMLREQKPGLIVALDATTLFDTTAFEAAKKTGTPMLFTNGIGPVLGTIFWDTTNMINTWVDKAVLKRSPTKSERHRVEQYISQMHARRPIHGGSKPRIVSIENARKYLAFIWNYVAKEKGGAYHNPLSLAKDRIRQIIRPRFARKFYSKQPVETLLAERFVFFALQTPDDGQIVARAQKFANQHEWAIKCARTLPKGVKLLVKEHPHGVGSYPIEWLQKMAGEPNIEIVPPSVSSHDLIKNSLATIVINSTVGWEALLYNKPVVVLSKPFYAGMGLTFDADGQERNLVPKIREAIEKGSVDEEKVIRLVNAVFNSLDECCFYKFEAGKRSFDTSEQNISRITSSLQKAFQKHWGKRRAKAV